MIFRTFFLFLLFILFSPTAQTFAGNTYYVSPNGHDNGNGAKSSPFKTIQKAVNNAVPSDTILLEPGDYYEDVISKRSGTKNLPIIIKGPQDAVVKGGGKARVIEINHSYITLTGFTVDGLHALAQSPSGYRDKLIFILGKEQRSGVTGLTIANMTIKNAGGECIRLRYFAQKNEIRNNTIQNCGVYDFVFNQGGKNGEGVYIGTAPEQRIDGKNPTKDIDSSNQNWIHHNIFNTQGNECVDIKEGSEENIVEYNECTGQKDVESAGLDSRGNKNVFRYNKSFGNNGAGIRLGGDTENDGTDNNVYFNLLLDNKSGGIKVQRTPQGIICGNTLSGNFGNAVGNFGSRFNPTKLCENYTGANVKPTLSPTEVASSGPTFLPKQPRPFSEWLFSFFSFVKNSFLSIFH